MSKLGTLKAFFKVVNEERCSDLVTCEIDDLPRSSISLASVKLISQQLFLTTGEVLQLRRFAIGSPLVTQIPSSDSITALLTTIGCPSTIPTAKQQRVSLLAVSQLTEDELLDCANALSLPFVKKLAFINGFPPVSLDTYEQTVTYVIQRTPIPDVPPPSPLSSSAKRRRRKNRTTQQRVSVPPPFASYATPSNNHIIDPPSPAPPLLPKPAPPHNDDDAKDNTEVKVEAASSKKRFNNNQKLAGSLPKLAKSSQWISGGPTSVPFVDSDDLDRFVLVNKIISTTNWEPTQHGRILRVLGLGNIWHRLSITHFNTGRVVFQGNPRLTQPACRLLSHFIGEAASSDSDDDGPLSPDNNDDANLDEKHTGDADSDKIHTGNGPVLSSLKSETEPVLAPVSAVASSSSLPPAPPMPTLQLFMPPPNMRRPVILRDGKVPVDDGADPMDPLPPPPLPPLPLRGHGTRRSLLSYIWLLFFTLLTLTEPTAVPLHLLYGSGFSSDPEGDGAVPGRVTRNNPGRPTRAARPSQKVADAAAQVNVTAVQRASLLSLTKKSPNKATAKRVIPSCPDVEVGVFVVDKIVDMRTTSNELQFCIQWCNFTSASNTWEPAGPLFENCKTTIADFLDTLPMPAVPTVPNIAISNLWVESGVATFKQERVRKVLSASSMCFQQPQIVALFLRSIVENPEHIEVDVEPVEVVVVVDPPPPPPPPPPRLPLQPLPLFQLPDEVIEVPPDDPNIGLGGASILTSVPDTEDDIIKTMLPLMCKTHVHSRVLGRLKPTRYLHDITKVAWKQDLIELYQHIHVKTEQWKRTKDPLLLTNTVLEFAQFPTCVLLKHTTLSKTRNTTKVFVDGIEQEWAIPPDPNVFIDPSPDPAPRSSPPGEVVHNCTITKRAVHLYKSGRRKACTKTLNSFGVGPRNEATRDALRSLTIARSGVCPKEPVLTDVPFVPGQVAKNVTSKAMAIGGIDLFGWSTDMLSLLVNVPATQTCPRPIAVHEEFIKMLSCTSVVPDAVAYFLAGGSYTPLNKVPAAENAEYVATGKDPKLRPINTGSMPMSNLGSNVLKSQHGRAAVKKVLPTQKGLGTKNGCDKAIHTMRAAYNQRKALLSLDGINAFNAVRRKAVLEAAKLLWPEATPFLQKFYNLPLPVLYLYRDKDGSFCVDVQHSWEGVKQGDTVSSMLYALTAHYYIYGPLTQAYPVLNTVDVEYTVTPIAIIDDFSAIIDCPPVEAPRTEWSQWYIKVAYYITKFDEVANPVNIFRNALKDKLLVPVGAPLPPPPAETFGIDLVKCLVTDGIVSAGSPIGTDEFMLAFATTKVTVAECKSEAIDSLCPDEPQVALGMIVNSANKGLDYLIRTTPTVPILPALVHFDEHIMEVTLNIICPRTVTELLPTWKVNTAKEILRLPVRSNGLDLCPTVHKAPPAYISSIVASGADKHFRKFKSSLSQTIKDACDLYILSTDLDIAKPSPVSAIIGADHTKLLSTLHTTRLNQSFHSQYGIMGVLMTFLQQSKINKLRQSVIPADDIDSTTLSRREKSEILHVLTTTSKSRIASTMTADLALPINRIEGDATRAIMCYNLSLPVHPYGQFDQDFGHPVQKCVKDNNAIFDTCGDHCTGCYYCRGQRNATHSLIRNAVVRNTTMAGFITTSEPNSYNILRNLFHTPDQLKALFPKYNDGGLAVLRRAALESSLEEIEAARTANQRQAIVSRITSDNHGKVPGSANVDGIARRADAHAVPDDGKGKSLLFDVTGIHCTAKEAVKKQLAHHLKLQKQTNKVFTTNFHLAPNLTDTPSVKTAVENKRKIYGLIETLANIQAAGYGPQVKMRFVAGVVTHRCEMAGELLGAIEYCVGRYKAKLSVTPHIDGLTPNQAGARYRSQFKTDLCVQMAKGFGRQLLATVNMSLSASVS